MAITKILNIMESEGRNPASHLKNALEYIQNPDKTEECVLVGSINCLPDTAFEQMEETKNIFHKTGKRQGYHVIISFSPEEKVTAEQAMYVLEHFAKDVLGDDYEVVYAVHTDREHMHGHLIWNSVSMTTGKKYNSPKSNWKNHLQPITNKYCDELGLAIMPAEYSRNPKNISRDKWEREMSMKEIILRDAKMCAYAAGNVEHFKYLMKRLGYVFKKDAWMEVQAPGFRYYHKLAKMDEMFSEDMLRHHVDMPWMAKPYFYSSDIRGLHRTKLSPFQKKFYAKLYRLRVVEQKRFVVGGAKYAEDLKRFHQLQDEYLLLVNNDIKSIVELVDFISEKEDRIQQIEDRQKEIYRESSSRKRSIKNEEQYREYQIWHVEVQEELDELKQEKKDIKRQIQLADGIIKEDLYTAYYAVSENEEIVADRDVEIPGMEDEAVVEKVAAVVDEKDIMLIFDEIQCGMGRTGHYFAWQAYGVQPDIMTSAKALGCGVPVGAFVLNEKAAKASLEPGDHGTTYGGNPFVCAAVSKVFDIYENDKIIEHVQEMTPYLEQKLDEIVAKHECAATRRGMGFMQGIVIQGRPVGEVVKAALAKGLLVISAGSDVLRIVPPLVITKEHIDKMAAILDECME